MQIEIFRSDPDNYTICQLKEILEVVLEFLVLIGISRIPSHNKMFIDMYREML